MQNTILISIICSIVSLLLGFFVKSLTEKGKIEEMEKNIDQKIKDAVSSAMKQHTETFHRAEVLSIVKESICDHEEHCEAPHKTELIFAELKELRTALTVFISQNGGSPKEIGLVK